MAINDPTDLHKIKPKFALYRASDMWYLDDIKKYGYYPGDIADLDIVKGIGGVYVYDQNAYTYLCELTPSYELLLCYYDIHLERGETEEDEERYERVYTFFEEVGQEEKEWDYIHARDVDKHNDNPERVMLLTDSPQALEDDIARALEDCEGDHRKAYHQLREEWRDYARDNWPMP